MDLGHPAQAGTGVKPHGGNTHQPDIEVLDDFYQLTLLAELDP
ncbi:hypothetical protein ACFWVU_00270 [Streptomyces sp. NPDC058686]